MLKSLKDPKTLQALKESIEHWERLSTGKQAEGEAIGCAHCALCNMFYMQNESCSGCPISEAGHMCCNGTPYHRAADEWFDSGWRSKAFKSAAKKELEFLQSLLPKQ